MAKISHSVTKAVHNIISSNLSYEHAVTMGYANLSALARIISETLKKDGINASTQAILSALKRYRKERIKESFNAYTVLAESEVSVNTGISRIMINASKGSTLQALQQVHRLGDGLVHLSKISSGLIILLKGISQDEAVKILGVNQEELEVSKDLALIVIHSPIEILNTAGCVELIYRFVSASGVNIEDTSSYYTDTLLTVKNDDAPAAFEAIMSLISFSKKITKKSKR